jgi:cytochrome c553
MTPFRISLLNQFAFFGLLLLAPSSLLQAQNNASFDGTSGILRLPLVDVPGTGVVDATLALSKQNPIQFTLQSATVLTATAADISGSPRVVDGNTLYIPSVQVGSELYELNMGLVSVDPIIFGNLQVLSMRSVPTTTPDPISASNARGQAQYAVQCANCHGSSGRGGVGGPSVIVGNFNNFALLRSKIHSSMPVGNPGACADNGSTTCATDVANYIINVLRK